MVRAERQRQALEAGRGREREGHIHTCMTKKAGRKRLAEKRNIQVGKECAADT